MKLHKTDKKQGIFDDLDDLYELVNMKEEVSFNKLPKNVINSLSKLQTIVKKNKEGLKEMIDAYLNVQQEWVIAEPSVYIARTRDIKTEIEYFTAKTFWPIKGGKTKEIKIYLGKAEEFGKDTMSIKAKEFAKNKMTETLRRRKDQGEI